MKRCLLFLVLSAFGITFLPAQNTSLFCGDFFNKASNIALHLNLNDETVNVPGFEMIGGTNGYMNGDIYGIWIVTKFKINGNSAIIRLSNDLGSETQSLKFTYLAADSFSLEMQSPQVMRKVEKRKLVKIPTKYIFIKKRK